MPTQFLMLPPQTPKTREWGARLAAALPQLEVIVAEDPARAEQASATAEAAFVRSRPRCCARPGIYAGCRPLRPRRPLATTIRS